MFLIDGHLHWSASDLTAAAECEYAILRTLDYKLGWAGRIDQVTDPLMEHISRLGTRYEETLLAERKAAGSLVELGPIAPPYTAVKLEAAGGATLAAFTADPDVVYQAAFTDGEFFGYADFVERADDGWLVCDAKLARSAKPRALLQLGAYADQIQSMSLPLSSRVALLLGNGERVEFRVADVLPVFRERRDRLRSLLSTHRDIGLPVAWGDDRHVSCGKCGECAHAAAQANDLILVAGLRMEQRSKLRAAGLTTIQDLAMAIAKPQELSRATFEKLREQASLQWKQLQEGPDAPTEHVLTPGAGETLALLPAPSDGDLFFDFEGDPLYDEGDLSRTGLEYLWGVMGANEKYLPLWAHSSAEERDTFVEFMDYIAECRAAYSDMHIYHYTPYETSALKRLAMRYQTREKELDDLLRSEVFVDLYATVRGAVRVSAPSYSIKRLEPLYMGAELRDEEGVKAGDASILAYHEFRELREPEPESAQALLDDLQAYNTYDCLSTLRLRDWLLERAEEAGVRDQIVPRIKDIQGEEDSDQDPVFLALMSKSGSQLRSVRSPEQQAYAMLATSIDYYRRERKQYWWDHFARLQHPVEEWAQTRDVFVVEAAALEQDWVVPEGRATNARRVLRLTGDWSAGSRPGSSVHVIYASPCPPGVDGPDGAGCGAGGSDQLVCDDTDPRTVLLTESRKPADTFADLPVALTPPAPPMTKEIEAAIKEVASGAATALALPRRTRHPRPAYAAAPERRHPAAAGGHNQERGRCVGWHGRLLRRHPGTARHR